jgi:membrane-associated protein
MDAVALPALLDGQHLVQTFGLVGLMVIVFAETGLLLGFFLPGDSLLFAAGFAAAGGISGVSTPPVAVVCLLATAVAIAGAQCGYLIGRAAGPSLFDRPNSRLFKASYVNKAEEVLDKYGDSKALVLARFVPIVRTFLNPLLGVIGMPARRFLLWNAVGGVLWGTGVVLLGYFLGNVAFIGKNLEAFAVLIVLISVTPILVEVLRSRRRGAAQASPRSDSE